MRRGEGGATNHVSPALAERLARFFVESFAAPRGAAVEYEVVDLSAPDGEAGGGKDQGVA